MMRRSTLVAVVFGFVSSSAGADPLLFRDVRIFDGTKVSQGDVLVENGMIRAVGPRQLAKGATVIEGAGRTLLPGLIDSHTHAYEDKALRQALLFGVTSELEMFGDPARNRALRVQERRGEDTGLAALRSAAVLATAPGGHGTEYGVPIPTLTRPEQAAAFVADRVKEGSDYLKIVLDDGKWFGKGIPTLDSPTVAALARAAHEHHLVAVVHIGSQAEARAAIEAGADGLAHLFLDSAPAADFASTLASRHAFVIPTLGVLTPMCEGAKLTALTSDERIAPYLDEQDVAQLGRTFRKKLPAASCGHALATVQQLRAAGVSILAGTDALNPAVVHGASLHRELELLVEAGLSPAEALSAATAAPATRFGLSDRGRIAPGLRADLVLVEGDPTKDIRQTRAIVGVWKGGVPFDRQTTRDAIAKQRAEIDRERSAAAPPGSEGGIVADFDDGKPATKFGAGLTLSTDARRGGTSTVDLRVLPGGAPASGYALLVTGEIKGERGWAGVLFAPGPTALAPANLSGKRVLTFYVKGDGKEYRVMLFARHLGPAPVSRTFVAGPRWTQIALPLATFPGVDGRDVTGILWSGGPQPGAFTFTLDQIELR